WYHFSPTQLNVAMLGNKITQLHVHVIGRFENDPAWPATVWDHPLREPYEAEKKNELLAVLQAAFAAGKKV
ncbi:MAG TPA: hypothetical protein VN457_00840, partial [Chlamydiales bacterium]|nr:hypothetical protein [Chlamydiales bacterium]